MVKKLLKYEFSYMGRRLGIFYPFMLLLFGSELLFTLLSNEDSTLSMVGWLLSGYAAIMAAFALFIVTFIFFIIRFCSNLYGKEGYLTQTLPVSAAQHLLAKGIVALVFEALSLIFLFGCYILMFFAAPFRAEMADMYGVMFSSMQMVPPIHLVLYAIELLTLVLLGLAVGVLTWYCCIAVGQAARRRKVLVSIGMYALIYAVNWVATFVVTILLAAISNAALLNMTAYYAFFHIFFLAFILLNASLGVLYFFISARVMGRRLNLG